MGKCLSKKSRAAQKEDNGNNDSKPVDENEITLENNRYTPVPRQGIQHPPPPPEPEPEPEPPAPKTALYLALYDYVERTHEDLSFKKGEILEVNAEHLEADWWWAKSKETGAEGFIPRNYVAPMETLEAESWYYGVIKRAEAEKVLLSPPNEDGAFLIRHSSKGLFALSMRDGNLVRHYRIRKSDDGGFFIARANVFQSLNDLVDHYHEKSDGLCGLLKNSCERVEKPQTVGLSYNTADQWMKRISKGQTKPELNQVHPSVYIVVLYSPAYLKFDLELLIR